MGAYHIKLCDVPTHVAYDDNVCVVPTHIKGELKRAKI